MNDVTQVSTSGNQAEAADKESLDAFLGAPAARPWWKRPLLIGAIAVGAIVLLLLLLSLGREQQSGFATQEVRKGNLVVTVSATGNLIPTNQVEVGSEQSGLVEQVYVDFNDRVVAGQPLARLDTSRLQDTIVQARAGLAAAEAQVAQAEASAAQARANLARQEEVFRISGGRVPSETELDAARAENRRAAAAVRSAQAQVAQARAQLSSAQTNLSKATIYSPVTGVVLNRQIDPGQTVAASFQAPVLFTIAEDLSQMELEVSVDEADVGQVHEGQRATFTVDAFPGRTFEATIVRVDVGANTGDQAAATTAANVVSYKAVLRVANPDLILRPGMTATADIVTSERADVLLVPNAALRFSPAAAGEAGQGRGGVTSVLVPRRRGGGGQERQVEIGRGSRQTVHVLGEDGVPRPVEVTVGATNGVVTEVSGPGLRPGMRVVTAQLAAGETATKEREGRGRGGAPKAGARGGEPAAAPGGGAGGR